MFAALYAAEGTPPDVLAGIAREFSPRVELCAGDGREVVLDASGLTRLFGDARTIAAEVRCTAADRGVRVRVAVAGTRTAARLLVRHRAGLTVVEPGTEAAALAPLPIALLGELSVHDPRGRGDAEGAPGRSPRHRASAANDPRLPDVDALVATFRRWGLRTLGDLAALSADALAARLGRQGPEWQRLSRGEDPRPLVPAVPEERFEQTLDLEWPIEDLEPLSFVLGRLMEPLEAHLARRDRGAAVLHVRLHLVRMPGATSQVHERSLQLPIPMRDARALRTLALLDLESHPPTAPIDRVTVAVDPTPGRILQWSLLTRPLPSPEQVATLLARLQALMGETRCGAPATVDSWQPGACAMKPFGTGLRDPRSPIPEPRSPAVALRRFRHPVPVRVQVEQGRPAEVATMHRGLSSGRVDVCAGPWRTSGGWVDEQCPMLNAQCPRPKARGAESSAQRPQPWDRDEWDVSLVGGPIYRLFRERHSDRWFIDGVVD
jgi:protein ImuB